MEFIIFSILATEVFELVIVSIVSLVIFLIQRTHNHTWVGLSPKQKQKRCPCARTRVTLMFRDNEDDHKKKTTLLIKF